MSLESSIFAKQQVVVEQLEPFGFVAEGDSFVYSEIFMAGDFEARVSISATGQVSGRVLDRETGEDYLALRVEQAPGAYASQVQQAYAAILTKIARDCFQSHPFTQPQSNRLAVYLEQTYGDFYDHPFAKHPSYASYRVGGKWYALIFPLTMAKLGHFSKSLGQREVEVVNLKVKPEQLAELLTKEGIYPSYHMSKKSWVSVVLDGSLSDEDLFDLVVQSRSLATPKSLRRQQGPEFWVLPANPKYYNIDAEFSQSRVIDWTQKARIKAGDYVAIYMTAPVKAIRYLCRVLQADLPNHGQRDREDIQKLMTLELLRTFPDGQFPQVRLAEYGLKTVRGPRRLPSSLSQVLADSLGLDLAELG
ncbi:MmcQ/YjbR family DNA-binding protein [Streptococcus cuniculipharyngis]|uniref:MmcQ family protein n=1 Tax=Streptococcus cuniculipharyngis TaxID=1562651 RepID=A0A5C5SEM1_9STRE|nr:MmcQ/YjbR family DNA-binding protein [Streptococcus cuniculipharyngis]TWS99259.1 MmcQ family protein [Streptococcus cuniculipharyngis]